MADLIILNVNSLNIPIIRQRLAGWMKNQDSTTCCLQEVHFKYNDKGRLKVKGWKKIYNENFNQNKVGKKREKNKKNKVGIIILISDKVDCREKKITRDREEHYIMI